jgi:hypothetical protein
MQAIVSNTAIKMIEEIFSPFPKIIGIGPMITITLEAPDAFESMPPIPTRTIPMKTKLRPIRKSLDANGCGSFSPLVIMFLSSYNM